jgi:Membrane bound O-acyl transferase family
MGRPSEETVPWWRGWGPLLILPTAVVVLAPTDWPPWLLMWALAGAVYVGCKWLTWRRTPVSGAPAWRHLGYLFGWPGLDARAFLVGQTARRAAAAEWLFAAAKCGSGAALIWAVTPQLADGGPLLRGWVGMVGLVFLLHFGAFHLLSCAWRSVGVDAKPLMNWPVRAESLAEFWGRRWNTAFRDFTHRFLFRPLSARLGPRWGLAAGFLFSGLVHDAVISWPAGGGYGLPTLYFALQGLGLVAERSALGRRLGLGRGGRGWAFTLAVVAAPVGWLFHAPFVTRVMVPFLDVLTGGGGS